MTNSYSICSLYGNPVTCGHIDYLLDAQKYGPVIVIVNSDYQVNHCKKSIPFMNENERMKILENIKGVFKVFLAVDKDGSVVETLKKIRGIFSLETLTFCNGGDRTERSSSSVEEEYCKSVGIRLAYGVGGGKTQSSSWLIQSAINLKLKELAEKRRINNYE